jgi:hypothetical protein
MQNDQNEITTLITNESLKSYKNITLKRVLVIFVILLISTSTAHAFLTQRFTLPLQNDRIRIIFSDPNHLDFLFTSYGTFEYRTTAESIGVNLAIFQGVELVYHQSLINMSSNLRTSQRGSILWSYTGDLFVKEGTLNTMLTSNVGTSQSAPITLNELDIDLKTSTGFGSSSNIGQGIYAQHGTPIPLFYWQTVMPSNTNAVGYGNNYTEIHSFIHPTNPKNLFDYHILSNLDQLVVLYVIFHNSDNPLDHLNQNLFFP